MSEQSTSAYLPHELTYLPPRLYDDPAVKQRIINAYTNENDIAVDQREQHLANFAENPNHDQVWYQAYALAVNEDAAGGSEFDEFGNVPAHSLIELAERVRTLPDFRDRYAVMSEASSNGAIWFDTLTGFSSADVEKTVNKFISDRAVKCGGKKFNIGLDLGSGTGRTTGVLATHCQQTIGVDASPALVEIANTRKGAENTINFVVGVVTQLPLPDKSVDIVTALGITGSLGAEQEVAFFDEVSRVLKDGAVMVDGYYGYHGGWYSAQDVVTKLSWKNVLADMIVDTVSGKFNVSGRLDEYSMDRLLARNALVRERYSYSYAELPKATTAVVYFKGV